MVKWHHFEEDEKAKSILIESRSSDLLALENLIYNMLVCTRREEISKLPLLGIAILSLCCSFPLTLKCCLGEITILDENSKAGLKRKKLFETSINLAWKCQQILWKKEFSFLHFRGHFCHLLFSINDPLEHLESHRIENSQGKNAWKN